MPLPMQLASRQGAMQNFYWRLHDVSACPDHSKATSCTAGRISFARSI